MNNIKTQTSEIQFIQQTVNYYLDGLAANNFEMISKAFHENATMKFIAEEDYKEVNVIDFFREITKKPSNATRLTKITSIGFSGTAANAQVEMELPNYSYFDFLNLLKIDGQWKIVGKIYDKKLPTFS